jgi:HPt (histidine-containing phosphotransfer) domain-containing protein
MFLSNGFDGFIPKPVEMRELKKNLFEWLPAEKIDLKDYNLTGREAVQNTQISEKDLEFQRGLYRYFLKSNHNKYEEIFKALEADDVKLAHRLAHTLKSNAGQIGKTLLQKAAADIELQLKDGKNLVTQGQMAFLEKEMKEALSQLEAEIVEKNEFQSGITGEFTPLDAQATEELIKKLEPMLRMGSPETVKFIESLYRIPGSDDLRQQIEDFEFKQAIDTLAGLKKSLLKNLDG